MNKIHTDKIHMSTIRTYKADELYPKLYGKSAYKNYLAVEAEIDKMMKDPHVSRLELCHLREENFRRMKAEGEKYQAEQALKKEQPKPVRTAAEHPLAA